MTYRCLEHQNETRNAPGECPECGADMVEDSPIPGPGTPMVRMPVDSDSTGANPPVAPVASGGCPNCGSPYDLGDLFCLNCNWDFAAGHPRSFDEQPPSASAEPISAGAKKLVAVVSIDLGPRSDRPADAVPPTIRATQKYLLDEDELIIGRLGQIVTSDIGCSRKHARLIRLDSGEHAVQDIGTTNNTYLNGRTLTKADDPGGAEICPVKAGDVIELGFWTRITISGE